MKKLIKSVLMPCVFLLVCTSIFALAEVKVGTYSSAIPRTGFHVFGGKAIRMNRILDNQLNDDRNPNTDVFGGVFGIRVMPELEVDGWIYQSGSSTALELQAKVVCWHEDDKYLSLAPGLISSTGKKTYSEYYYYDHQYTVENCTARGFEIPLIYTLDTKRNLFINVSAGINCQWVKVWGSYNVYNEETYQYNLVDYDYDAQRIIHGKLNASMEANYSIFSFVPEFGVTIFEDEGQQKQVANYGASIGFRW